MASSIFESNWKKQKLPEKNEQNENKEGFVYAYTGFRDGAHKNGKKWEFPDTYTKIGRSNDPRRRQKEWESCSKGDGFQLNFFFISEKVSDQVWAEKLCHAYFESTHLKGVIIHEANRVEWHDIPLLRRHVVELLSHICVLSCEQKCAELIFSSTDKLLETLLKVTREVTKPRIVSDEKCNEKILPKKEEGNKNEIIDFGPKVNPDQEANKNEILDEPKKSDESDGPEMVFKCGICEKTYKKFKTAQNHFSLRHPDVEKGKREITVVW